MTSLDNSSDRRPAARETYADSVYRSPLALVAGVLLLALAGWLGADALVRGTGATRLVTAAVLLVVAPLVVAFTLRPAVFVGAHRLRVRNPFRTIDLPWGSVDAIRATLSTVVHTEDAKYQIWALPVSLRDRKKAMRASAEDSERLGQTDRTVRELNDMVVRNGPLEESAGEPVVSWSWPVLAPLAVGVVALVVLLLAP
ncbi:PH domain-containing protein [Streptomyces meridianus]|uniref:PH domain-containing protein n=1 Tax=Streptomyces meridianus TaxID=2938945 RepID=A0ABT0X5R9_9ACTN|nr:PH domain-containing protein [Streptomyces meridianus]MCM2577881.1 PH domain-containing protein [Streptomyces meridianus]